MTTDGIRRCGTRQTLLIIACFQVLHATGITRRYYSRVSGRREFPSGTDTIIFTFFFFYYSQ